MNAIEDPPGFVVRTEAQKAAWDNGYHLDRGVEGAWLRYSSTTAKGDIWIAAAGFGGPWFVAVAHPGVASELTACKTDVAGPGVARFTFTSLGDLYAALERLYQLGVCLPDSPLLDFRKRVADLPRTTEVERLMVQRVGQNVFRDALLEYWNHRCPLTGISEPALLRASHIVPWAECDDDAHRLDVHNGLLLSALWDAAFDAGLIGFSNQGDILVHSKLNVFDRARLFGGVTPRLSGLTEGHLRNIARHRAKAGLDVLAAPA